jgi:hypothetical protein
MSRSIRPVPPAVLFLFAGLLLTPSTVPSAATPQTIKVQGALTDRTSGPPTPAQGTFNMTFALFDSEFGGLPITTIGPLSVDVVQGRFQAELPLSTPQFQAPDRYLQITVNGETLTPRVRLTSAPFSLVADQSAVATSAGMANTSNLAMSVAAGGVGTSALAAGAVTADKLGIPCATGEILIKGSNGWTCTTASQAGAFCPPGSYLNCYTGPAGTLNVGACRAGTSACNSQGNGFDPCQGQVVPAAETCDAADNDCDGSVDENNICPPCPDADNDGYGAASCIGGTDCNDQVAAIHPGRPELCNGFDDDCDPQTSDGSADPQLGSACDGPDADRCLEGVRFCAAGSLSCTDTTTESLEVCNGLDDDCDGDLPVAERDADADGYKPCTGDCNDFNSAIRPGAADLCDTVDNDCNPSTPNGSADPQFGTPCDGTDSDLCFEGTRFCTTSGIIACNDITGGTFDVCNGLDDDCDPGSADGSEDQFVGTACDGPNDTDLCKEGIYFCSGGALGCTDSTTTTLDLCNGADDDCDPASADGAEDPQVGAPCDGPDADFCDEGTYSCSGGTLHCSDTSGNTAEICGNGTDDDCDGVVDEGC